jgi:ABC-type transport system involved in cytochrome bd biosynthesis fused ATPase/permease subunit
MSVIAESIALAGMTPRRAWLMIIMSTISPFAQNILTRWYRKSTYPPSPQLRLKVKSFLGAFANPEGDPVYIEQSTRAETMKFYAHSLAMRPELSVFGLKNWVLREYQKSSNIIAEMEQPAQPGSAQHQFYNYLVSFAQTGTRAMMYLLVAIKSDYFRIPLPSLAYLEQSTQSLFNHTWSLYSRTGYVLHDLIAIQELFECMEMQPAMKVPEIPAEYESAESDKGMKIELRDVSFKYPDQSEFVLKDISFVLQAGETLALLGFNGSGMHLTI